jgi:hypothetical protein
MNELYGRGMEGGGDGRDSAADVTSETDRSLRPVDENGHENWGEDAEQLTRGEYADLMRQGPAAERTGTATATDENHEQDDAVHLQAIAEDDRARDGLPEPRTRQEVADEARSGADPFTADESGAQVADPPVGLPDKEAEHTGVDQRERHDQDGSVEEYARVIVVKTGPADRTLGDVTPSGIGLKPSGEQLVEMEDDSKSRLEKLRSAIYERSDDITDAGKEYGGTLAELFERPPSDTHAEVPGKLPEIPHHPVQAIDGGQVATAAFVVGVLGFELFRRIKNMTETRRSG